MRIQLSLVAALFCALPAVFAHADGHLHARSLKVSKDGRCGGYTGWTCDGATFGNCCSKEGKCGKSATACGTGCQKYYGTCKSEISTDGKCGKNGKSCWGSKFGDCCNKDGWCGKSDGCCGKGCQTSYGKCASSTSKKSSTKTSSKSTPHSSTAKAYSTTNKSSSIKASVSTEESSSSSGKAYSNSKKSSSSSIKAYSTSTKSSSSSGKASSFSKSSSSSTRSTTYPSSTPSSTTKSPSTTVSSSSSSISSASSSTTLSSSLSSSSLVSSSDSSSSSTETSTSVSSSASDTASSASSVVTPTGTPPACPKPNDSCVYGSGSGFLITCDTDYFGADSRDSPQQLETFDECIQACDDIPSCVVISWVEGTNGSPSFCYLKKTITDQISKAGVAGAKKVDVSECPVPVGTSTSESASTTASSTDAVTTDAPSATTTDFDEEAFLATYTYYEVPLPTFDTMIDIPSQGLAPAPTQICFADPTDSSMQFEVLDTRGYPITNNAGKLGLPATPPTNETVYPYYHFETPSNAPAGFQDLVYESDGGYKYAARKADGSVILVDASTNGETVNGYATTVFTIECDGRMAMGTPDTHYVWALDGDFTKATVGTGHSSIILLPVAARNGGPPITKNKMKTRRTQKNTKRSFYNEGQQPRCPNNPPDLVARDLTKAQGGRDPQANGCGSAGIGGYLVPDYKFTPCCDVHDLCYDNCANGKKENCDSQFGSCMHSVCDKIPWWQPFDQYACPRIADFYEWFVSTWGNSAFKSANTERCGCFCPHRYDDSLPENDSFNCGGCGNTCPDKTHCKSSKCVCNQDTCGNSCVDTKSHPKNCGACGNVCGSGICRNGECYTPKSVTITKKCPANKVWLNMGRTNYYSKYGYGNLIGDVRDLRGDSDAQYYGDPERYSLNNHGLGFSLTDCCDTCYSMDDCIAFYLQKQYDQVYCWTMNQERKDTYRDLSFNPPVPQCHYGGFYLQSEHVGLGGLDNGWSDSIVEYGPCYQP